MPGSKPMNATRPTPSNLIDAAIEAHGAARVLLSAMRALLRPKARPPDTAHLSPHLRRDIGLPPAPHEPSAPWHF